MHRLDHRAHRYIDYAAIAFLLLAPGVFGFAGSSATVAYVWALVYVGLALVTAQGDDGVWHLPFKLHGGVELAAAAAAALSPWAFGFANDIPTRNFFVVVGAGIFFIGLLTDYRGPHRLAARGTDRTA